MPGGDRTGPAGLGPMTGRAAGFCAGYSVPGFMNPAWGAVGRGWGYGGGGGRGWGFGGGGGWRHRNWYRATGMPGWQPAWPTYAPSSMPGFGPFVTKEQEIEVLRNQAKSAEQALDDLRKRIHDLETKAEGSETT